MLWECLRPRLILPGTLGLGAALAGAYLLAPDAPILLTVLGTLLFAGLAYLLRRGRRNKAVD
jgi:LPXTG-motif cell wall-anchored protein